MASDVINKYKSYKKNTAYTLANIFGMIIGVLIPAIIMGLNPATSLIYFIAAMGLIVLPLVATAILRLSVMIGYLIKANKDVKAGNLVEAEVDQQHHIPQNFYQQFNQDYGFSDDEKREQRKLLAALEDQLDEEPKSELLKKFDELEKKYGIDDEAIKKDPKYIEDGYVFFGPVTHSLFYEPVIASDGGTYEKEFIENYFGRLENNNSPWPSPLQMGEEGAGDKGVTYQSRALSPVTELLKKMNEWVDYKLAACRAEEAEEANNSDYDDQGSNLISDPRFPGTANSLK